MSAVSIIIIILLCDLRVLKNKVFNFTLGQEKLSSPGCKALASPSGTEGKNTMKSRDRLFLHLHLPYHFGRFGFKIVQHALDQELANWAGGPLS